LVVKLLFFLMNSSAAAARVNMIMLIDDNDTDNFLHKRVVELSGFARNIVTKDSGKTALEYLRLNKNSKDNLPDIIFLDLKMPQMDGFGFLFEFQNFPGEIIKKCKIVILTSSNSEKDFNHIKKYNFVNTYITKPLSEEALFKMKL
jgi:CheY-like chemotaxis protein